MADVSCPKTFAFESNKGVSLVEVLIAILIVVIASIATLRYFSYGLGGIGKQGNRRAALERARERLEQLLQTNISAFPQDTTQRWAKCLPATDPCQWALDTNKATESVSVDGQSRQMETSVQWVDDVDTPPAGEADVVDTLTMDIKVWFTSNTGADDDFNRVHLRTLRATTL